MSSEQWFLENGHWIIILGIIVAVLGVLFSGYGFLDRKGIFLRGLSQGFSFAVVGGFTIGLGLALVEILLKFIAGFVGVLLGSKLVFAFQQASNLVLVLFISGLLFGVVLSFMTGLVVSQTHQFHVPWSKIVFSLILGSIVSLLLMFLSISKTISATIFQILGALSTVFYLVLPALLKSFWRHLDSLPIFSISWRSFSRWLLFGSLFGLLLALLMEFLFHNPYFATIVLINGILIGIIGGQPDKLVKQPKLHYRLAQQQNVLQPLVTWQRFYLGILVGLIDGTLAIGLFSGYFLAFAIESSNRIIVGVMGGIIFGLASGFATSLMAGIIYGFGPMLAFKIANLTERRLGQIGIALTILGIIMASLPSLIS